MKKMILLCLFLLPCFAFSQGFPHVYSWNLKTTACDSGSRPGCFVYDDSMIIVTSMSTYYKGSELVMFSSIEKSTDMGATWNELYRNSSDTLPINTKISTFNSVSCFTKDWYWVHGDTNIVYETKDGGKNWELKHLYDTSGNNVYIYDYSSSQNMILGGNSIILFRVDKLTGDITRLINLRKNTTLSTDYWINEFDSVGDSTIYIVARPETGLYDPTGWLIKSTDAGQSWNMTSLPDSTRRVYFYNDSIGWLSKWRSPFFTSPDHPDAIYKTTNGGITWIAQRDLYNTVNSNNIDFFFWNENEGIAFGLNRYLTTVNGGATWEEDSVNNYIQMNVVPHNKFNKYSCWTNAAGRCKLYHYAIAPVGVNEPTPIPENISLSACPTPFTESTVVKYTLETAGAVTIRVMNSMGEKVTEREFFAQAGEREFSISGVDLPAGVYFCDIITNGKTYRAKTVLVR
jgi:photosystem II stability/assembly factor-like uncharacterized protein